MFNTGESAGQSDLTASEADAALLETAVSAENLASPGRIVLVCDHASNHIPREFDGLGLGPEDLARHIAWDPGALGIARGLARRTGAPLVAGGVSRLVIDCNREPGAIDSIPLASDGTVIPGNADLAEAERLRRRRLVYDPFHAALEAVMAERLAIGPVALVSIHTFTPVYGATTRPWDIGILYDRDTRLAGRLLRALRAENRLVVGENEPYSPDDRVYHTLDRHAQACGLASAMIEIRNDLVTTPADEARWAERLASLLSDALPGALAEKPGEPGTENAPIEVRATTKIQWKSS